MKMYLLCDNKDTLNGMRLAGVDGVHCLGQRDDLGLTARGDHVGRIKSWDLYVHFDALLRRGDQLRAERLWTVVDDARPLRRSLLLCEGHDADDREHN